MYFSAFMHILPFSLPAYSLGERKSYRIRVRYLLFKLFGRFPAEPGKPGILIDGKDRKLNGYLAELNERAEDMFFRLVKELAEIEGITETLKASDQMEWVQRMNAAQETATEIVNHDLIYV